MKKFGTRLLGLVLAITCSLSAACAVPEADIQENLQNENTSLKENEREENIEENREEFVAGDATARQLVKAVYPEMAQYPETDGFNVDEEAYNAWRRSRQAQQSANKDYQNGIREFYEATMQEFLTDTEGKNKVYSPLNVYMALAMLAETTEGESRQQILNLLHTDSMETLRNNASILWNANYSDEGTVTSLLASSAWLSNRLTYNQETLNTLAEYYYASSFSGTMGSAEYNKMLQDWLNEQTGGLLEDQAANIEMDPLAVFTLATTVYFRAKWTDEFNEKNNTEEIFHAASGDVKTEFMHQSGTDSYYWGENFSAITRGMENSGEMVFILPDEGVSVESLLTDNEVLDFIHERFSYSWENKKFLIVNQSIPKFDVVSDYSLIDGLKNLGVTDVFNAAKADFSPLLGEYSEYPVAVDEATHAARVMIDEEGCVAAAFTVMQAAGSAMPPEETVDFVLDRPFLFVIKGLDGQPLFIGVVNQPK